MNKKTKLNNRIIDILIVGGGPAGMAAAISAKQEQRQLDVVLVEKNKRVGKKLGATGNGRCNITNLKADKYEQAINFLHRNGIATVTLDNGYVYPNSESAADVVALLERRMHDLGVEIICEAEVVDINKITCKSEEKSAYKFDKTYNLQNNYNRENEIFSVTIKKQKSSKADEFCLKSKKFLIATGGKSMPVYGSTGDIIKFSRNFGHKTARLVPSLTPVECVPSKNNLAGIRSRAKACLIKNGAEIYSEAGEVQFTKFGLSGICIFNLSRKMRFGEGENFENFEIRLKLIDSAKLRTHIKNVQEDALSLNINKTVGDAMCTLFKAELSQEILDQTGIKKDYNINNLQEEELETIVNTATNLCFKPTGLKGWKEAQCTSGGVMLSEVDEITQESKLVSDLYFAGEALDYDGPCGGYNLTFAWVTGENAGKAAARIENV